MSELAADQIRLFLTEIGNRYKHPATLYLLGGSALLLLGNERPTLDIDYVGDDLHKNALQKLIDQVATEMHFEVEALLIESFVPVPPGADQRHLLIGRFGILDVFIYDPYTIALSKIDRGFDSDIDDVVFLIHRTLIKIDELERYVHTALQKANEFGLTPSEMQAHLQAVHRRL